MTGRRHPTTCTARRTTYDEPIRRTGFGDPTRRGDVSPFAAAVEALSAFVGFLLFTLVVGALAPLLPPFAAFLAFWLVGLPTAFAASVVGVRLAVRARRRLRRFACARWRVGCDPRRGAGRAA